ncbi:hypothetical protein FOMPIDRAFT_117923, partial [Fomitopsis schrenkii]
RKWELLSVYEVPGGGAENHHGMLLVGNGPEQTEGEDARYGPLVEEVRVGDECWPYVLSYGLEEAKAVHQAVRNHHSVALVEPAYGSDVEQPWLTARQPQRSGRVARSEKARAVHLNGADGPHHHAAPRNAEGFRARVHVHHADVAHSSSRLVRADLGSRPTHVVDAWKVTDEDVYHALVDLRNVVELDRATESEHHGGQTVGRESSDKRGLIRAVVEEQKMMYKLVYLEEDEVLNGLDTGDDLDGLALGELLRNCRPEGNEQRIQAEDLSDDENTDGDEAEGGDLGKDLLQVAGGVVVLTNEQSGTIEECVEVEIQTPSLALVPCSQV